MVEANKERTVEDLYAEIECLKSENVEIRARLKSAIADNENKDIQLANAEKEISFLRGEVEAFKFVVGNGR